MFVEVQATTGIAVQVNLTGISYINPQAKSPSGRPVCLIVWDATTNLAVFAEADALAKEFNAALIKQRLKD